MDRHWIKWLLIGLFIFWLFIVLGGFFAIQKPFSAAHVLALENVLLDLVIASWLVVVSLGMGTWFLHRFFPVKLSFGETQVFGAGLGLGTLGLLNLFLGLAGLFQPIVAYLVIIALSVISGPQFIRLFHQWRRWQPGNLPQLLPATYLIFIAIITLLLALLPPADWDGLFYHLTGPKLYLHTGGIIGGIDIPHLNFPSLMEMLFAWAMLLRGDIAAKLLHSSYGLLLAGLVYLITSRFLSRKAAWLAVVIFASMPMVSTLAGWAYNDLALTFYQLASLYLVIRWRVALDEGQSQPENPSNQLSWLVLSGIFAGLAMGLKYTSFVTPVVMVGLILWVSVKSQGAGDREQESAVGGEGTGSRSQVAHSIIKNLLIFILSTFLVALPWYLKTWILTGNPFYPFLYEVFDGQFWDEFRTDWYAAAGTGIGWRPGTLLALPWLLTLGMRDMNYWDGRTGPLLLLFLPLIIWAGFARRFAAQRRVLGPLLIYALVQYGFWVIGVMWSRSLWQSRLLLTGLAALAPIAGWLWGYLPNFDLPSFSLSRFVNVAIGLALALTVVDLGLLTLRIDPLPYLIGLETRDAYLTRRLGAHYEAMQQVNEVLPPEATIVFLWEPRSYYCQRDCRPDSILDTFPHLVHQYGSAEAIAQAWREGGVTHVLIHRSGLEFVVNEAPEVIDTAVLKELEEQFLKPEFDVAGAYQVYVLRGGS